MRGSSLTGFAAYLSYFFLLSLCYGRHAFWAMRYAVHCRLQAGPYRTFDPVTAKLAHERRRATETEADNTRLRAENERLASELARLREEGPRTWMNGSGIAWRLAVAGAAASILVVSVISIPMRIDDPAPASARTRVRPRPVIAILVIEVPQQAVEPFWRLDAPLLERDPRPRASIEPQDAFGCSRHEDERVPLCWDGCPDILLPPREPPILWTNLD